MTQLPKERKTLSLKRPLDLNRPALEYQLIWNEERQEWDIYRSGLKTGAARRKLRSAIDIAILAVQSDQGAKGADVRIVSVKKRASTLEWTRTRSAIVKSDANLG
jgi:hypothetical protein